MLSWYMNLKIKKISTSLWLNSTLARVVGNNNFTQPASFTILVQCLDTIDHKREEKRIYSSRYRYNRDSSLGSDAELISCMSNVFRLNLNPV